MRLGKYADAALELLLDACVELNERSVPTVVLVESLDHGDALAGI